MLNLLIYVFQFKLCKCNVSIFQLNSAYDLGSYLVVVDKTIRSSDFFGGCAVMCI